MNITIEDSPRKPLKFPCLMKLITTCDRVLIVLFISQTEGLPVFDSIYDGYLPFSRVVDFSIEAFEKYDNKITLQN